MSCLKLTSSKCPNPLMFYTCYSSVYRQKAIHFPELRSISNHSYKLYKNNIRETPNWLKEANLVKKIKEKVSEIETLELYYNDNSKHLLFVRIMAILQGLFWLNLGHLIYTRLGEYNEETGKPELFSYWKRVLASGMTLFMAVCTGVGMFAYTKRLPFRLTLLGKSSKLRIETARWPLSNKVELLDLQFVAARNRLIPGEAELYKGNKFFLSDLKRKTFFMLDLKGKFSNIDVFNTLFYKPGAFEKQ